MDKKRKFVQFVSAFLSNANINGFLNDRIYQGGLKSVCVPGLNCYSCPGALGACPLGALQSQIGSTNLFVPFYVMGFLMLFGTLLGRLVCGWLCPFGLFQEILHFIPSKKITPKNKYLPKLKYLFLVTFVVVIPVFTVIAVGFAVPGFCKYICPAGTVFAGFPLILTNKALFQATGTLFLSKTIIAITVIILSIFFYRPFCRYVCPLGAIYGFFNKISLVRMCHDSVHCTKCGVCRKACKMNICPAINANSHECIRCGRCVAACSAGALKLTFLG